MIDFVNVAKNAKILVALSGGVDSSTTLALLQEQGYKNIAAITLLLHENNEEKGVISKDQNVVADTTKIANTLGIKVHYLDIKNTFNEEIINPFLQSYAKGITMNPCIKCNRVIKFGLMLDECKKMGFDILVTGHYIKWQLSPLGQGAIYMGKSDIRDQSYFLSQVKQEALNHIRFPLANMTKSEVREHAARLGLHVAQKKSSADICFAGIGSYTKIINKQNPNICAGDIVNMQGKVLGKHLGIHNFTVGQRKGIGIGGFSEPLFVVGIDEKTNTVTVGTKADLAKREILLKDVNWLGDEEFTFAKKELQGKIRASQPLVMADLYPLPNNQAKIIFKEDVFGVAKGQSCSFYANNRLLGGGYIVA